MSCFIKAIREYCIREHGYDPADPEAVARWRAARPSVPLSEILKRCPLMTLDPEFPDEQDEPDKPDRGIH